MIKRKKREKRKISCLVEKLICFWKEMIFNFFLKKNSLIIVSFWEKKCVYIWRVNAVKIFSDVQNGFGWMYKLIKEYILEILGWLK